MNTLDEALTSCLDVDRRKRKEQADVIQKKIEEVTPATIQLDDEDDDGAQQGIETNVLGDGPSTSRTPSDQPEDDIAANPPPAESLACHLPSQCEAAVDDTPSNDRRYRYAKATLEEEWFRADPGMFYSDEYMPQLAGMIEHVIDTEGPIHENVLIRRIARHHGFQRAGRQIRDIVINMAKSRHGRTQEDVGLFFWRKGTVRDRVSPARYEGRDDELRKIEHICAEEIRAIKDALSLSDDPVEFAHHIGIARVTRNTRERINNAIQSGSTA